MRRWRSAAIGGALILSALGPHMAAADPDVCDDQASCIAADDPGMDGVATVAATPTVMPTAESVSSTGTLGPPVVVDPFGSAPATSPPPPPAAPVVVAPGSGADPQHLPPGPPNRVLDP